MSTIHRIAASTARAKPCRRLAVVLALGLLGSPLAAENGLPRAEPESVRLSSDLPVYVRGPGYGFGLGFSVLRDPAKSAEPLSPGSFSWGGAWGTIFWIDPVEEMVGVFMTQISRYNHLKVRQQFGVLATQAIIDSWRDETPKVMGYQPRH